MLRQPPRTISLILLRNPENQAAGPRIQRHGRQFDRRVRYSHSVHAEAFISYCSTATVCVCKSPMALTSSLKTACHRERVAAPRYYDSEYRHSTWPSGEHLISGQASAATVHYSGPRLDAQAGVSQQPLASDSLPQWYAQVVKSLSLTSSSNKHTALPVLPSLDDWGHAVTVAMALGLDCQWAHRRRHRDTVTGSVPVALAVSLRLPVPLPVAVSVAAPSLRWRLRHGRCGCRADTVGESCRRVTPASLPAESPDSPY